MRAVFDVNDIISALMSRQGASGRLLTAWRDGAFELVVSPRLLAELARALSYPKVRERVDPGDATGLVELFRTVAVMADDLGAAPLSSRDPDDDYLIALSAATRSVLVTGDADLIELRERIPVMTPRDFLDSLDGET